MKMSISAISCQEICLRVTLDIGGSVTIVQCAALINMDSDVTKKLVAGSCQLCAL